MNRFEKYLEATRAKRDEVYELGKQIRDLMIREHVYVSGPIQLEAPQGTVTYRLRVVGIPGSRGRGCDLVLDRLVVIPVSSQVIPVPQLVSIATQRPQVTPIALRWEVISMPDEQLMVYNQLLSEEDDGIVMRY